MELFYSDSDVYSNVHSFDSPFGPHSATFRLKPDLTFEASAGRGSDYPPVVANGTCEGVGYAATLTFAQDQIWGYPQDAKVNLELVPRSTPTPTGA